LVKLECDKWGGKVTRGWGKGLAEMCEGKAGATLRRRTDEGGRRERRRGRRMRREDPIAGLRGAGLVERKGRRWHRCQRVADRGLVNVLLPGGRVKATRSL